MLIEPNFDRVCQIESDDSGNFAQISRLCIDDVNRILGEKKYKYKDRLNRKKAEEIFQIYTCYYAEGTIDRLRVWNGGPHGKQKQATLKYIERYFNGLDFSNQRPLPSY